MSKYNQRDKNGKFVKIKSNLVIRAGSLYSWKNIIVRAFGKANGKRLISHHRVLTGFVEDSDLQPISKEQVLQYISNS